MASQKGMSTCSYGAACYRRNIEHFRLVSHPHLDELLDSFDDAPIIVPDKLNFPCTSRSLLKEQLKVLQIVRKTKTECGEPSRANVEGKKDERAKIHQTPREQALSMMRLTGDAPECLAEQGKFAEKHKNAAPYYMFFTTVQKARATWSQNYSVTLPELLDKSIGKIIFSLHLNFVVDIGWLCAQYMLAEQKANMVVFYGQTNDNVHQLPDNIKMHKITCPNRFGCHHPKLSIFEYEDNGIRVVVSTANLYKDDWYYRTQGLWMSPHLPRLPTTARASDGESETGFKEELLRYLGQYGNEMERSRAIVKRTDFSAINVALIFSVPGSYRPDNRPERWGHKRLADLLQKHVEIPDNERSSTIIGQASSMGNFGPTYSSWLGSQLGKSMVKTTKEDGEVNFKVIFPTIDNYKQSYDMREAVNCLCYTERGHMDQSWLRNHLHKWVANHTARTSAIPHIKTFTQISSDEKKIWWFVLGSANLSKAAWGYAQGKNTCILNYEASVIFLPKFVTGTTFFPVKSSTESTPAFPIPYDLPLSRYNENDKPFVTEFFQRGDEVFTI